MAAVQCVGCNGSGRIHRGYDGRRIRCPECMGRGRVSREYANRPGGPGDTGSRSPASPKRSPRDIPAEIFERRQAAQQRRPLGGPPVAGRLGTGRFLPLGVRLRWVLYLAAYRLRRLFSALYRRVPGAGRSHSRRASTRGWWRVVLIWIGLLAAVLAVGEITGFLDSWTWPWGFQVPDWWPG